MTTVLGALENAQANFQTIGRMGLKANPIFSIALEQLNNAITALENGMKPEDTIQENVFSDVKTTPEI